LSENKSRFKIRKGEIEIEFEGPAEEVSNKYKEAFDWVKSVFPQENLEPKKQKSAVTKIDNKEEKKKGTRGPEIWAPAIESLIGDSFFKLPAKRNLQDVSKALQDKALSVQGKSGLISQTLVRKVRKGALKGTHGPNGWVFWTE
jgi:hypothetical protein